MAEPILQVVTGLSEGVWLCIFVAVICINSFFLLKYSEVSCSYRVFGGLVKTIKGRGVLFISGAPGWCFGGREVTALLIDF